MTRVNTDSRHTPWFAQAGAPTSIVPISRFVGPHEFALKNGGCGCLFSHHGIDEEGRTDEELLARVRSLEGALRGLPEGACLTQYARLLSGFPLPRQAHYENPATAKFMRDRLRFLDETARFRRVSLYWCLTVEPSAPNLFRQAPKVQAATNTRRLAELQKAAVLLESHFQGPLGLKRLNRQETFSFFSYLFNLEEWAEGYRLRSPDGLDRQIVNSTISWEDKQEYLRVGKRFVQVFSLSDTPLASRPCLLSSFLTLDCDSVLCASWRPKSVQAARKEIRNQEKFIEFFKLSVLQRLLSGRDVQALDTTAGAKAATGKVDELSEVIKSLDEKTQGDYMLRLLLAGRSLAELRENIPAAHRLFVEAQAPAVEETLGNLSAFYSMFPGNGPFNPYPLWLREDHHARLSPIFAPHTGYPHSEDLDREYLNILETRTRTPYFQDVYVNGVRVMLIIGPTRSGKSVHANQMLALEQKYDGFSYVFDVGGSYESNVELYGGRVDRIGVDGPRTAPFRIPPTAANLAWLYQFVRVLLTKGGAILQPEDDEVIHKAVQGIYFLEPENRRLSHLYLPRHLQRYLVKWIGSGVYSRIFDNAEDTFQLSRVQCFDFQGVNNKQNADLIEPLMVFLFRRIQDVLYDPAHLGVPKHILIEELFTNLKNRQLLENMLDSVKTVSKYLGGVTLIGQSANDLGEHADLIVNSCSTFLFLPDPTFNRARYRELFELNDQQMRLFESLQRREALYIRKGAETKVVTLNLDPHSYAAFSTKPKDKVRRSKLVERYGLAEGLERFAKGEVVA